MGINRDLFSKLHISVKSSLTRICPSREFTFFLGGGGRSGEVNEGQELVYIGLLFLSFALYQYQPSNTEVAFAYSFTHYVTEEKQQKSIVKQL